MINRSIFKTERGIYKELYLVSFSNDNIYVSFDHTLILIWLKQIRIAPVEIFRTTETIRYTFEELKD